MDLKTIPELDRRAPDLVTYVKVSGLEDFSRHGTVVLERAFARCSTVITRRYMQWAYLGVMSSPEAALVVFPCSESRELVELKGPAQSSP